MSESAKPKRRGRGGREERLARGNEAPPSKPYVTRKIPCFEVLDEAGYQLIEDNGFAYMVSFQNYHSLKQNQIYELIG